MALRVAGITNQSNGHEIKNIRTGVNENHQYDSYRLSLTWQPSDDLTARLKYTNMEGKFISPRPIAGSEGPVSLNPFGYVNPLAAGFGTTVDFPSLAAAIDGVIGALAFWLQVQLGVLQFIEDLISLMWQVVYLLDQESLYTKLTLFKIILVII